MGREPRIKFPLPCINRPRHAVRLARRDICVGLAISVVSRQIYGRQKITFDNLCFVLFF